MTEEVLVSVRGFHSTRGQGDEDEIELISPGKYYFRNGKHYVLYEEVEEESGQVIQNRITLKDRHLEVQRKGQTCSELVFEEDKKNVSWYHTGFGSIHTATNVNEMYINEQDDLLEIIVKYELELNYEHAADSRIAIRVMAKDSKHFHLT